DDDVVAIADHVLRLDRGRVIEEELHHPAGRSAPTGSSGDTVLVARGLRKQYRRGPGADRAPAGGPLEPDRGGGRAPPGRSGAGKSPLLAVPAGLARPDAGELRYELRSTDPAQLPWAELAFLPQRFGLLPELSVRENVELPARLAGVSADVDGLLERLGL